MLTFNADLFRIAYMNRSYEATRYYLGGVFILPAANGEPGARMVATDGHTLTLVYDPSATDVPERGVILTLDLVKPGKLFTTTRRDGKPRVVRWKNGVASVYTQDSDGVPGSLQGAVPCRVIDGSFPDFMRVVPDLTAPEMGSDAASALQGECFQAHLVERMGAIGGELGKLADKRDQIMQLISHGVGNPAAVTWPGVNAVGVIMPFRRPLAGVVPAMPWLR